MTIKQILTTILILALTICTNCGQTLRENETLKRVDSCLLELEKVGFYDAVLVGINEEVIISGVLF